MRPVGGVELDDAVERIASGLDTDFCSAPHRDRGLRARESVHERLGDGLDGELAVGVADLVDLAVGGDDADGKPVGIGFGQLGDVGGDVAFTQIAVAEMQLVERRITRNCTVSRPK